MYKCIQCGEDITNEDIKEKVRCPHCGFRVITKAHAKGSPRVEAK